MQRRVREAEVQLISLGKSRWTLDSNLLIQK
jgi:hypothetical protein